MLRLKNLANKYQKRTCRPLYANTQATPYAARLHSGFRATDGSLQLPTTSVAAGAAAARAKDAFTYKGSLVPGLVLVRAKDTTTGVLSEQVTVATGAENEVPFGLLANFVGGDLDEGFSGDSLQNSVGVWRGPDSVFEILSPAFDSDATGSSSTSVTTSAISVGATTSISVTGLGTSALTTASADLTLTGTGFTNALIGGVFGSGATFQITAVASATSLTAKVIGGGTPAATTATVTVAPTGTIKSLTYPPSVASTSQTTATVATNAFGAQAISTAVSAVGANSGIYLYAGVDGRLVSMTTPGVNRTPVARLIDNPATSRIVVDLLV